MLTAEDKAERSRQRMLESARQYQLGTYSGRFVAPVFQQMIRAEAASWSDGIFPAIVQGEIAMVARNRGQCVCATCGKILPWKGNGPWKENALHTGHFLASRRNSILFEEDNVAPQCNHCNYHRDGEQQLFRKWILSVRGPEVVERLEKLKATTRTFTREELVDMRIAYKLRLDNAIAAMAEGVWR